MRNPHRRAVAAAAGAAAVALALTGCQAKPTSGHGTSSHTSKTKNAKKSTTSKKSPKSRTTTTSTKAARCRTGDLDVEFATGQDAAPDMASAVQQKAWVSVRNTGARSCTIGGFAGVDLVGGTTTWSLNRSSAHYRTVTLKPNGTTDFSISFLPEPGGSFVPQTVTLTPPDETAPKALNWPWGPVLLQDGATHPGTFVNPVG